MPPHTYSLASSADTPPKPLRFLHPHQPRPVDKPISSKGAIVCLALRHATTYPRPALLRPVAPRISMSFRRGSLSVSLVSSRLRPRQRHYPSPPVPIDLTYEVKGGDTLFAIARAHSVSLDSLIRANGIPDASLLRPGQMLRIPTLPVSGIPTPTLVPTPVPVPGDSSWSLGPATIRGRPSWAATQGVLASDRIRSTAISASGSIFCAVRVDGTVQCWGRQPLRTVARALRSFPRGCHRFVACLRSG